MYARRVIPILLIAGGVMMIMKHKRLEFMGQCEEGEERGLHGPHSGPHSGPHGEWGKRVPPLFEKWHQRAHEQEAQLTASAPAI